MIALDTSVVVACFGPWHEHHDTALELLTLEPRLPAHTAVEAYSVLTRLPDPFRTEPTLAAEFLRRTFPAPRLVLESEAADDLPGRLAGLGIAGGATYDALIALTARHAGAELVTLDKRAHDTYRRCGTATRLIGPTLPQPREET